MRLRQIKPYASRASTYLFVGSIVVLVLALCELTEVVELPFESAVLGLFTASSLASVQFVTSTMMTFGYAGLFALMFLESASLPVPSEVILPFAGYMVFTGGMNMEAVILVGTLAGVCGALADYCIALWLGRPTVRRLFRWSGIKTEHLDRAEEWLDKEGSLSILVSRFIPGLRSAISLPAGALRMRLDLFVLMTTIGALGWSVLLVYIGYFAGAFWQSALTRSSPVLSEAALLVGAGAAAAYIVHFLASGARPQGAPEGSQPHIS